jgi:hypothetical protein
MGSAASGVGRQIKLGLPYPVDNKGCGQGVLAQSGDEGLTRNSVLHVVPDGTASARRRIGHKDRRARGEIERRTGTLGTLTIGQAPRPDVVPIIDRHVPERVRRIHRGVLDGLSHAEIAARYLAARGAALALYILSKDGQRVLHEHGFDAPLLGKE